jgi:hypothetical protein
MVALLEHIEAARLRYVAQWRCALHCPLTRSDLPKEVSGPGNVSISSEEP